jgi:hypothetical protein
LSIRSLVRLNSPWFSSRKRRMIVHGYLDLVGVQNKNVVKHRVTLPEWAAPGHQVIFRGAATEGHKDHLCQRLGVQANYIIYLSYLLKFFYKILIKIKINSLENKGLNFKFLKY